VAPPFVSVIGLRFIGSSGIRGGYCCASATARRVSDAVQRKDFGAGVQQPRGVEHVFHGHLRLKSSYAYLQHAFQVALFDCRRLCSASDSRPPFYAEFEGFPAPNSFAQLQNRACFASNRSADAIAVARVKNFRTLSPYSSLISLCAFEHEGPATSQGIVPFKDTC